MSDDDSGRSSSVLGQPHPASRPPVETTFDDAAARAKNITPPGRGVGRAGQPGTHPADPLPANEVAGGATGDLEGTARPPPAVVIPATQTRILVPLEPEGDPWGRLVDEPALWYDRLHAFVLLGPRRSLQEVYRREYLARRPNRTAPKIPGDWLVKARAWRWRERAEAYDEHDRQKTREAIDEAKREARQRRIAVLNGIAAKMAGVLNARGAEQQIRPSDAAVILLRAQSELRAEMDDEPRRRVAHGGDPDAPAIAYKVYLVDPANPASPEDL